MQYIAGWPAGCPSESLLERITRKLRDGWKRLIDIRPARSPKNGSNNYGYPDCSLRHFYWR
ncbi:MAG: protease FtsH-inhibitory lysogeny factor CIII [Escherichia sp.]